MKTQILSRLCLCIVLAFTLNASAQKISETHKVPLNEPDLDRPKLFKEQSEKININTSLDFKSIVRLKVGQTVNIPFSNNFSFAGTIVSVSDGSDHNVKSIVVRSTIREGAVLTFSEITNEDKTISYAGRIMSHKHGDALDLVKEDGKYLFKKKGYYDLISE